MKKLSSDQNIKNIIVTMGIMGSKLYEKKNKRFYHCEKRIFTMAKNALFPWRNFFPMAKKRDFKNVFFLEKSSITKYIWFLMFLKVEECNTISCVWIRSENTICLELHFRFMIDITFSILVDFRNLRLRCNERAGWC